MRRPSSSGRATYHEVGAGQLVHLGRDRAQHLPRVGTGQQADGDLTAGLQPAVLALCLFV